jgi:hypothetical protein
MHLISDKERLENIKESDIIDAIKGLVGKSETYLSHVDETAIIADVNWLIEQAEKAQKFEEFAKTYYNCFLDSRHINENMRISHNDQYFLYARANKLLGEPNGKRID